MSMGFMLSDVTTDAILVERSKHEPAETRGSMQAIGYSVRFVGRCVFFTVVLLSVVCHLLFCCSAVYGCCRWCCFVVLRGDVVFLLFIFIFIFIPDLKSSVSFSALQCSIGAADTAVDDSAVTSFYPNTEFVQWSGPGNNGIVSHIVFLQ